MQKVLFSVILGLCCQTSSWADDATYQTDRYTLQKTTPTPVQFNPLDVVLTTELPQSITSIGQAARYLLARSGYQLAQNGSIDPAMRQLLALPLPESQRKIENMTLMSALQMLGGVAYVPVIDPVHRLVAYDLRQPYRHLMDVDNTASQSAFGVGYE